MRWTKAIFVILVLTWGGNTLAQDDHPCGPLRNHYGPFDYNNPVHRRDKLPIVEKFHFNSKVENLIDGINGPVWTDLNYTLRTFPNHHRALYAMAMWQLKHPRGPNHPPRYLTIDCYFDRALRFTPRDGNIWMIYGIFLHRKGLLEEAMEKYKKAEELLSQNATLHYNLGLLLLDMEKTDEARTHAKKAYALGYPLPGLRDKLKQRNAWE